jgi:Domain of unknown function (DUF5666)/Domain of unknown function (DUF4382)
MASRVLKLLFMIALFASLTGCGGTGSNNVQSNPQSSSTKQSATFVTGDDAPLPSVLDFNVTINSIVLNGSSSSTGNLLSAPETVDFARLVGLRNLLAFNSVAAGIYSSVTFQLASPSITYLDLTTIPPSTNTITGSWASGVSVQNGVATITVALKNTLTLDGISLVGLHMHFDLRNSLQTDMTGQVTGMVNPQITANTVQPTDDEAQVTDLRGSIASTNTTTNTFVLQKWDGKQITVDVNSQTTFNDGYVLGTLAAGTVAEIEGTVQSDGTILASNVDVVATEHAYLEGPIIYVNPNGASITVLVNEESVAIPGVSLETPITLNINAVQRYSICGIDNWVTNFLFGANSLVVGQHIAIGGSIDNSTTPGTFVPARIRLERQGVAGDLVLGSVSVTSGNTGSFQLQNNALLGYVLGAPLTVKTANGTKFMGINGLSGIANGGNMMLEVRGLVLKDPTTGTTTMYAHWVKVLQ